MEDNIDIRNKVIMLQPDTSWLIIVETLSETCQYVVPAILQTIVTLAFVCCS